MDKATREIVINRAGNACEYCQLPQSAQPFASFHVDHVIATQHRLDDRLENLCLSCQSCNLHKGTNLTTIDPASDEIVRVKEREVERPLRNRRLYHRRQDRCWPSHGKAFGHEHPVPY